MIKYMNCFFSYPYGIIIIYALQMSSHQAARSYLLCCQPATDINNIIYDSFIDERAPAAAKGIVVRSHDRFEKQTHRTSRQIKISLLSVPRPRATMNYSALRRLRHLYNIIYNIDGGGDEYLQQQKQQWLWRMRFSIQSLWRRNVRYKFAAKTDA